MTSKILKLTKFDVARSQLKTAIELWFHEGDPVSIHALASAAYEIIHVISKKRNPNRRDLIFDSIVIKDEYRKEANIRFKKHANFFKHALNDHDATIGFNPEATTFVILFTLVGLQFCVADYNDEELAFQWWLNVHRPDLLTDNGKQSLTDLIRVDDFDKIQRLSKRDFLEAFLDARTLARGHKLKVGLPRY
ncbi:MAG TPA: hypothetical protein VMH84_12060 [Xanthobacteraceae bacterium]|nr:hypothetical protein [Xanthobacteraceae bacterium]